MSGIFAEQSQSDIYTLFQFLRQWNLNKDKVYQKLINCDIFIKSEGRYQGSHNLQTTISQF